MDRKNKELEADRPSCISQDSFKKKKKLKDICNVTLFKA